MRARHCCPRINETEKPSPPRPAQEADSTDDEENPDSDIDGSHHHRDRVAVRQDGRGEDVHPEYQQAPADEPQPEWTLHIGSIARPESRSDVIGEPSPR